MNTKSVRFCGAVGVLLVSAAWSIAGWGPAGLQGIVITAIDGGRVFGGNVVVAGTAGGDVAMLQDSGLFVSLQPPRFGAVRSLELQDDSLLLLVGADSGLYRYRFTSGVQPSWIKCTGIERGPVTDIIIRHDTAYGCTPWEVYQSVDNAGTWSACHARDSLPMLGNITSFTSLAFWDAYNSVAAGSRFGGSLNSWDGVMLSIGRNRSWDDISLLPGQTERVGEVRSLVAYSERWNDVEMLVAGAATGVFFVVEIDTGIWHPMEPQLKGVGVNHLDVTFRSRSLLSDLFASTDSGLYVLSTGSASGAWERVARDACYGVASWYTTDPRIWFVATGNGVYRYDVLTTVGLPRAQTKAQRHATGVRAFGIDGRLAPGTGSCGVRLVPGARNVTVAGVIR